MHGVHGMDDIVLASTAVQASAFSLPRSAEAVLLLSTGNKQLIRLTVRHTSGKDDTLVIVPDWNIAPTPFALQVCRGSLSDRHTAPATHSPAGAFLFRTSAIYRCPTGRFQFQRNDLRRDEIPCRQSTTATICISIRRFKRNCFGRSTNC